MKHLLTGLLAVLPGTVIAATFNQFSPATGVLKGNSSTYVTTAANSADIRGLWTGSCDATTFLRGDGACASVTVPSAANPSASIGLSAVNGVAATFMRSDAAPALSQSITPTWTSPHVFTAVAVDATPTVTLSSTLPMFALRNTGSDADEKRWDIDVFGDTIFFYSMNDAANNAHTWLKSSRTGAAINDVTFGNGSDNPTYTFPSSGTAAFTGDVTVGGSSVCRENGTNCPAGGSSSVYPAILLNDGTMTIQAWTVDILGTGSFEITTSIADTFACAATGTLTDIVGSVQVNVFTTGGFNSMEVNTEDAGGSPTNTNVNLIVACQ